MIALLLALQMAFSYVGQQDNKINLELGLLIENNPSYVDSSANADASIYINPDMTYNGGSSSFSYYFDLETDYKKYVSETYLDRLDYIFSAGGIFDISEKWQISSGLSYNYITEPSQVKQQDLIERSLITADASIYYQQSDTVNHQASVYTNIYDFQNSDLSYLVNQTIGANYGMHYYFLPETAFIVEFDFDNSIFPDGTKLLDEIGPSTTRFLYDSIGYKVAAGFEGRLTEYSNFYFSFGYHIRSYEAEDNFNEPVFEVSFQEQITPQDTLIAGYDYKVLDSFYTNHELNQQMYLGYSRILGDRILLLFRSNYMYKSFSRPNRREDQKLYGTAQIDYSYQPNWLIKAGFSGDILISDSLNQEDDAIDPATSYQAFQLFVSTKVVF